METSTILNFNKDTVRIIPFGGCGEFGMNLTAYIVEDRIYVVDAGISFPDPGKLGIEALYPDMDAWFSQFGGVYAYVITHGHEDHIGALPYLMQKWPGPIYATPWTATLINNKLARRGILPKYPIHIVKAGDIVKTEDFTIEYVHVNHSIPDACGLFIKTPTLKIFHTGDFKIDQTPVMEAVANLKRLHEIGDEGVDLLLADSTNAHIVGPSPSESVVEEPIEKAMSLAEGAVLVTTFSSNFWRIKTIFDACISQGRKVLLLGSGIEASLQTAADISLYTPPTGLIVDASVAMNMDRNKLAVILTGSQGEWRSALMRLANGDHRQFSIMPGDMCIFSSRTIPGNERVIQTMMSLLERRGARIYSARDDKNIHVSGHGYRDDLAKMLKAIRPKTFIPVHGTFSHMQSNSRIPNEIGLTSTKCIVVENGDVIDLGKKGVFLSDRLDINHKFVDSESYVSLSYEIMRERLRIGELGLVVVSVTYSKSNKKLIGNISVTVQGISDPNDESADALAEKCRASAQRGFDRAVDAGDSQPDVLTESIRVEVRRTLHSLIRKKPVVIAHVLPV
ncbi:MAG: ribonuclease J [Proteobacteria bacterium]|nr:ribonuclease J [Pseudomonadota bacterium]